MNENLSRRAVIGAAWAVPVVVLAVATPAAAASGDPAVTPAQASWSGSRGSVALTLSPAGGPPLTPAFFTFDENVSVESAIYTSGTNDTALVTVVSNGPPVPGFQMTVNITGYPVTIVPFDV